MTKKAKKKPSDASVTPPPSVTTTVVAEPWCNIEELSKHTGLSVSSLKRLVVSGEIPATVVHGRVLFKKSRVDAALEAIDARIREQRNAKK